MSGNSHIYVPDFPRHLWLPEDYHPYPYHNPHSSWFNMVESIPIPKQISWSSIFIMVKFLLINGYIHLNPIISRLSMVDFLWINAWSLLKSTAKKTGRWDPLRRWWSCQCPAANWFGLMWCVFLLQTPCFFEVVNFFNIILFNSYPHVWEWREPADTRW